MAVIRVLAVLALASVVAAVNPPVRLEHLNIGFPNPIDIAYSEIGQNFILTVNYPNGQPASFNSLSITQDPITHQFNVAFAPYGRDPATNGPVRGLFDEVYLAIVPNGAVFASKGWTAGDVYFGTGEDGVIGCIRFSDGLYNPNFLNLNTQPGANLARPRGLLRGGLTFDHTGVWENELVVTTSRGEVWLVRHNPVPHAVFINSFDFGPFQFPEMEVAEIVPNNPVLYGALAGKLVAGRDDEIFFFERTNPINPVLPPRKWRFLSLDEHGNEVELENLMAVPANAGNEPSGPIFWGVDYEAQKLVVWRGPTLQAYQNLIVITAEKPQNPVVESAMYTLVWATEASQPVITTIPLQGGNDGIKQWEGATFAPIRPPILNECPFSPLNIAAVPLRCKVAGVNNPDDRFASLSFSGPASNDCIQVV